MRLIFFGTAGATQSASDGNVCLAVTARDHSVLVDASGNPVMNLKRAEIDPLELDVLVLTHAHTDHIYALPSLIHNLWLMKREKTLKIISDRQTRAIAENLLGHLGLLTKRGLFPLEWICEDHAKLEPAPSVTLSLFPTRHSVPSSGIRIAEGDSVLVYASDTSPVDGIVEAARGARALIHEASGRADREAHLNREGHSSGRQAGIAAARAGVGALYLCHFDYREDIPPAEMRREAQAEFSGEVVTPERYYWYEV